MYVDYFSLCASMRTGAIVSVNGTTGTVRAIEMEDGTGNNFNVKLLTYAGIVTVFVRLVPIAK